MTAPISPRVANATGAAGGSAPLTILFLYYLNKYTGPLDPVVAGAWAATFTTVAGFAGGWLTRIDPTLAPLVEPPPPPPQGPAP